MNRKASSALASVLAPFAFAATVGGCAADTSDDTSSPTPSVGESSQALSTWGFYSWGTTNDLDGLDTNLPTSTWSCFLSGVAGDVSMGTTRGSGIHSRAGVGSWLFDTTWHVFGYGGKDESGAFIGNPVNTFATCVPHPRVGTATWTGAMDTVGDPVKIADIGGANRRCFLTNLTGGYEHWSSITAAGRVRKVTVVDADHPTTGYYVEGTEPTYGVNGFSKVTASCVDFPVGTVFQSSTLTNSGSSDATVAIGTALSGVKACALTEVKGSLQETSWTAGIRITSPSTASGGWTLTVSPGRSGTALCAL